MKEQVLVVDRKLIDNDYGVSSEKIVKVDESNFFSCVINNHKFKWRDEVENDNNFKQIVAYCILSCGNKIFVTKRLRKQTEVRLHDRLSIGVGGHINTVDDKNDNLIVNGMERELHEEVFINCDYTINFVGLINDNSTDVNCVHTGVCFMISLDNYHCSIKEIDKMTGEWIDVSQLQSIYGDMEGWSQIAINSLFGAK